MSKFEIGTKVKVVDYEPLNGEVGVIVDINSEAFATTWLTIEFEKERLFMHDGNGKGKNHHCYLLPEVALELYDDAAETARNEAAQLAKLCMEFVTRGKEIGIPLEALLLGVRLAWD